MSKNNPILILGMHRSGTSCMTGCLEEAGLYLGDVNTEAPANKKGNRENIDVMKLHDGVLSKAGATWENPPCKPLFWQDVDLKALGEIINSYPDHISWGTKDPRVLFAWPGWEALCQPQYVGTFRHPIEVATSLMRRAEKWGNPMSEEEALSLWTAYNAQLLNLIEEKNDIPLLRYDIPVGLYNEKLRYIAKLLGLDGAYTQSFRDVDLHNEVKSDKFMPPQCVDIWERLMSHAL